MKEFQIDSLECTKKHKEKERDYKEREKVKKEKIQGQLKQMLDYV